MIQTDVLIIGAGLTGLSLHHYLKDHDIQVRIVEARERIGGRIHTVGSDSEREAPVEMGATWLGSAHKNLYELIRELGAELFQQTFGDKAIYEPTSMSPHQLVILPDNQEPSYRVRGGTASLVEKLADGVSADHIYLQQPVHSISELDDQLSVECESLSFKAQFVISTLPPSLLEQQVEIMPELPVSARNTLAATHTWMGESIKFGLTFKHPFWRENDSSGTVFSNVGPITEMYDHSSFEDDRFALMGFLNGSYFSVQPEEREKMVLAQLRKYYGDRVDQFLIRYREQVWINEKYTYVPYDEHVLPHQNNGHNIYQSTYLNGKLFIAGAETSRISPGYMDGAVNSAQVVYKALRDQLSLS